MAEDSEKNREPLKNKMMCHCCSEEHLHEVVFRDNEKVTIECAGCGFRSNKPLKYTKPPQCTQPVKRCEDCRIYPCEMF